MCLGIPGKIVRITDADRQLGEVSVSGILREVNLSCIAEDKNSLEKCLNEWVLVHVGFAMSIISETEAQETLKVLTELGEMQEELEAMQAGAS
ncbi:MAG: HypC/HybG/HupF family hydrogenase formation chaperone [Endozoicomonas sp.]